MTDRLAMTDRIAMTGLIARTVRIARPVRKENSKFLSSPFESQESNIGRGQVGLESGGVSSGTFCARKCFTFQKAGKQPFFEN